MTRSTVAATLLFTAVLTGCDSLTGAKAPEPDKPKADTPTKTEPKGDTGKLGEAAAPAKAAIATANGEASGVRIEITELGRMSGDIVTLKFTIVNDSTTDWDVSTTMQSGGVHRAVDAITLVDPVGKKRYFVVQDTEGKPLCSTGVTGTPPGSRTNLWAKFPAPPADVKKLSVVFPHFDPLDDVPLS